MKGRLHNPFKKVIQQSRPQMRLSSFWSEVCVGAMFCHLRLAHSRIISEPFNRIWDNLGRIYIYIYMFIYMYIYIYIYIYTYASHKMSPRWPPDAPRLAQSLDRSICLCCRRRLRCLHRPTSHCPPDRPWPGTVAASTTRPVGSWDEKTMCFYWASSLRIGRNWLSWSVAHDGSWHSANICQNHLKVKVLLKLASCTFH